MSDVSTEFDQSARKRRHLFIGVAVVIGLLALGGLAWYLVKNSSSVPQAGGAGGGGAGGARRGAIATTVGLATAETASLPITLEALGTVTPTATVTVRPQVSGTIVKVLFHEGQLVKANDVLANIDPRSFENTRMQAEGNLQRDQADLASANLTLQRYQQLLKQDSIAAQDVDSQQATVKKLQGTVVADQASLNAAKLNLSYTNITAPVAGRVGLRVVDVGNYIAAGDANGVAVITVVDPIDVQFAVPQDQIQTISRRVNVEKATLSVIALDRTRATKLAEGQFSTLDNRVSTDTGTVRAKARFANKDGSLFPNQFVNVRVEVDTVKNAVVVPAGAVRQGANGYFVYVLDAGSSTVAVRNVKTGKSDGERVIIVEGLAVGEQVITEGGDRLKDGASVQLPNAQPGVAGGADGMGMGMGQGMGQGMGLGPNGERRKRPSAQ